MPRSRTWSNDFKGVPGAAPAAPWEGRRGSSPLRYPYILPATPLSKRPFFHETHSMKVKVRGRIFSLQNRRFSLGELATSRKESQGGEISGAKSPVLGRLRRSHLALSSLPHQLPGLPMIPVTILHQVSRPGITAFYGIWPLPVNALWESGLGRDRV
jgi:hypothetical protein